VLAACGFMGQDSMHSSTSQLYEPQNLRIVDNRYVVWEAASNSRGIYELSINRDDENSVIIRWGRMFVLPPDFFEYNTIQSPSDGPGTVLIEVRALGDGMFFNNSQWTTLGLIVFELLPPQIRFTSEDTDLIINAPRIEWEQRSLVSGHAYEFKILDDTGRHIMQQSPPHNPNMILLNYIAERLRDYDIANDLTGGIYSIRVRTILDENHYRDPQSIYLYPSDWSNPIYFEVTVPDRFPLAFSTPYLEWDFDIPNHYSYRLYSLGGEPFVRPVASLSVAVQGLRGNTAHMNFFQDAFELADGRWHATLRLVSPFRPQVSIDGSAFSITLPPISNILYIEL